MSPIVCVSGRSDHNTFVGVPGVGAVQVKNNCKKNSDHMNLCGILKGLKPALDKSNFNPSSIAHG